MRTRLLVVEDDGHVRSMIAKLLSREGFDVTGVDSGRAALERLRTGAFDAVLLDVMLPDMDGISIMRTIREDPSYSRLVVVMLTARTDQETTWEGWKAGCDYYMTKPFDPDEVAAVLKRLRPVEAGSNAGPPIAGEGIARAH